MVSPRTVANQTEAPDKGEKVDISKDNCSRVNETVGQLLLKHHEELANKKSGLGSSSKL